MVRVLDQLVALYGRPRALRRDACVLFAPIRFRRLPLRGPTITIEVTSAVRLSPRNANSPTGPDAAYRVMERVRPLPG